MRKKMEIDEPHQSVFPSLMQAVRTPDRFMTTEKLTPPQRNRVPTADRLIANFSRGTALVVKAQKLLDSSPR